MTGRLNHGKSKARRRAQFGERIDRNTRGTGPSRAWRNLRAEWDGPEFPVTTTLRAKDYNGHTPDELDEP